MGRLIDADTLIKWINGTGCFMDVFKRVTTDIINKQPTVDAVPVVRCQNCKHYCGEDTYTNHRICKMWNEEVFANGYCYYGERKDGAE